MATISIIIPVYNTAKYIENCINSLINQTFKDIEIICINDGSTDGSFEILKQLEQQDNRIVLLNQKNSGPAAARNNGLRHAKGQYIMFCDSDDSYMPSMCEKMLQKIQQYAYDMVMCDCNINIDGNVERAKNKRHIQYHLLNLKGEISINDEIKTDIRPILWNKIFKKDLIDQYNINFPDGFEADDNAFIYQYIACLQNNIYGLDEKLYNYTIRANSIMDKSLIAENPHSLDIFHCFVFVFNKLRENKLLEKNLNWFLELINNSVKYRWKSLSEEQKGQALKLLNSILKGIPAKALKNKEYKALFMNIKRKDYKKAAAILSDEEYTSFSEKVFSIKNEDIYKVITILGLEFKIKSEKLKQKLEAIEKENKLIEQKEYELRKNLPEEKYPEYLQDWFYQRTGEFLDFDNPQTFNEKIQWLKLYDSTPIKTRLADKYLVRDWVKEKIGEEYLIPLLGVWEKFDDIDFDKLPDKFVLKANHGSGWNIIVTDKNKFDKQDAKEKFEEWLHTNYAFNSGLELHYKDIKPLIIAEEYIETPDNDLNDYKFLCFNGEVKYVWVDKDRYKKHKRNLYDVNWNLMPKQISEGIRYKNFNKKKKPENYNKMLEFAKILSKDFAFVRVDFYENKGKLYFGEMTFTSANGTHTFHPASFNYELGQLIDLSKIKQQQKGA